MSVHYHENKAVSGVARLDYRIFVARQCKSVHLLLCCGGIREVKRAKVEKVCVPGEKVGGSEYGLARTTGKRPGSSRC